MPKKKRTKGLSEKRTNPAPVFSDGELWIVKHGRLVPAPGRPENEKHLFRVVGEKLPYDCLAAVRTDMEERGLSTEGVYVAHDSMGFARYIGRGQIFVRLAACFAKKPLELAYFSFYVVLAKKHEREIETALIRCAGPLLYFNTRKKNITIQPGNIRDYEPGTQYYERQWKKGPARQYDDGDE